MKVENVPVGGNLIEESPSDVMACIGEHDVILAHHEAFEAAVAAGCPRQLVREVTSDLAGGQVSVLVVVPRATRRRFDVELRPSTASMNS